jgi:hypothetical protein
VGTGDPSAGSGQALARPADRSSAAACTFIQINRSFFQFHLSTSRFLHLF